MSTKKHGVLRELSRNRFSYLLVLPAALYTFIFGYWTLPYMVMAFQRFRYTDTILTAQWIGLKNFDFFVHSNRALMVTMTTLRLNILYIVFVTVFSVALAILLNEMRPGRATKVVQSAFIFPYFLSWVIASYIVYLLFSTEMGVVNSLLKQFGAKPYGWYQHPQPWTAILTSLRVWKEVGMTSVIYLAALTGFDRGLYEAATIDGANRAQQIFRITIPLLLPLIAILTLLSIGRIFYGDFAMIYSIVRDNGLLYPTTDVIDTYVFRALRLTGDPAQAMAAGLYQSLMGFIMVFGSNAIVKRYFREGALF